METAKISKKLLKRLPGYLAHLKSLPENSNVSATSMAKALGLGDVQVRKDLAKVSDAGRRRTGRGREQLIQDIESYLDLAAKTGTVVIGVGKLGRALLDNSGFEGSGLNVMAGFDLYPCSDQTESGKPIYPMSRLESFCRHYDVRIGIIAVPAESAQNVCDSLVVCGITAIWNFAPVHLKVPSHVVVQNENLAVSGYPAGADEKTEPHLLNNGGIIMKEFELKYGCNPNQKPAWLDMPDGTDLPFTILNGRPGYINFMDALNSWQLVKELKEATGMACATSFKHVSPTSAAVGKVLPPELKKACFVEHVKGLDENPLACAYVRARGTDRMCSFGDWVALSDVCDELTASLIAPEVSDGVIAPGYTEEALAILKAKRKGSYNVVQIDPDYVPKEQECKEIFGIAFHQGRNNFRIDEDLLSNIVTENKELPANAKIDLIVSLITLKYTQSNSVCYAYDGQAIGVGAGQQSRIHCTRLAGTKADTWFLRQHPKTLALPFRKDLGRANRDNVIDGYINGNEEDVCADGIWQNYFTEQPERLTEGDKKAWLASRRNVALGSDAFFPFSDNIKRAFASGVKYIAQPGGSIRDDLVIEECDRKNMVMAFTGMRLFHH